MSSYFFIISNHPPLSYSVQTGQSGGGSWGHPTPTTKMTTISVEIQIDVHSFFHSFKWLVVIIHTHSGYGCFVFVCPSSPLTFFFSSSFFPSNKNIKYVSPDRWSINIMELHKQSTGTTAHRGPFLSLSFYLLVCRMCKSTLLESPFEVEWW